MSDYSDILNRKKTSDKLGDAFSKQADSMRPMNVGQRREQALLRGLGVGLNNDDEREAKLAELEEQYKQMDAFERELKMSVGKSQKIKADNENFFLTNRNDLATLNTFLANGDFEAVDVMAPTLIENYKKITGRNIGEYAYSRNGKTYLDDGTGNAKGQYIAEILQGVIPENEQMNFPELLTYNSKQAVQAKMDEQRLKNEQIRAQIANLNAHGKLYEAQSNPDALQAEIDYKKAQAKLVNQKADNVGSGDNKKLFDEIYKANVNYLSDVKTNIENNKKVLGAYDNIGSILTEENADRFTRTGPSIKAAALRFLNPSFDEGTRREAELEMESQPLYLDLKKLFGFNPSNTDIALFIKTLPTMGKDYNANMNAINKRKEEIKKDIFKAEETRKLVEESNYKLLHSHSSIDEIVSNRWDKKVLQDSGKVKIKLKDGSISTLDKEKNKEEIDNLISKGLGEIIE